MVFLIYSFTCFEIHSPLFCDVMYSVLMLWPVTEGGGSGTIVGVLLLVGRIQIYCF
jgi:hypothetical protein